MADQEAVTIDSYQASSAQELSVASQERVQILRKQSTWFFLLLFLLTVTHLFLHAAGTVLSHSSIETTVCSVLSEESTLLQHLLGGTARTAVVLLDMFQFRAFLKHFQKPKVCLSVISSDAQRYRA